jgi:hypothetical protein
MAFQWDGSPITNEMIQSVHLDYKLMRGTVTYETQAFADRPSISTTTVPYSFTAADLNGANALLAWARGCITTSVGA